MGRGNWFPSTPHDTNDSHELVYAELIDVSEEADQDEIDFAYECFKDTVSELLPKSFTMASRDDRFSDFAYHRDDGVVAHSSDFYLVWDCDGDYYHQGIAFVLRPGASNIAAYNMSRMADRFFRDLSERYDLRVRSCAWTSGPYVPKAKPGPAKQAIILVENAA